MEAHSHRRYFGKYRGTVVNNVDPLRMGRIQALVPDVSNVIPTSWALPCVPVGGSREQKMGFYAVPPVGASVWVEFEQGDPDHPIWVGCFWDSSSEVPSLAQSTPPPLSAITLQTVLKNGIVISDLPGPSGGVALKSPAGASLIVNDTGIYLDNGKGAKVELVGNTVKINNSALTVT